MAEKKMRICTVGHEVPMEGGGHTKFIVGVKYPADAIEKKYSKPAPKTKEGGTDK